MTYAQDVEHESRATISARAEITSLSTKIPPTEANADVQGISLW
jgi:hypothetical protein